MADTPTLIGIAGGAIAIGIGAIRLLDKFLPHSGGNGKSRKSGEIPIAEWELFFTKMKEEIVREIVEALRK